MNEKRKNGFEELPTGRRREISRTIMTNSGSCMISCSSADGVCDPYKTNQFTIKGGSVDAS
jgi:hypothetical protein